MGVLFAVVALTLAVSAVCSLLEATLYSTRVATLEASRQKPKHRHAAERFLHLKKEIAAPTSAILILNTIANTAGATLAGMYAAEKMGPGFVPLFSAAFTLAILLLSEILPKTAGATHWKLLWPYVSWPLTMLVKVLAPAVWLTERFAALFTGATSSPAVTEDEIRASIRLGGRAGELSARELQMLDAVFRFEDVTVREIMVPRDEVVFANLAEDASAFLDLLQSTPFSRYPACDRSLDSVVGMLHVKDLSRIELRETTRLTDLLRDVPSVPETLSIARVLKHMQDAKRQMAIVVDEFGTTAGLITVTDILEQIVGTLDDEMDSEADPTIARDGEKFTVRGNLSLDRINRELGWDLYEPSVVTLSGLLVSKLGRLLREGDSVELDEGVAEVVEVRANRATRVRLSPRKGHEPASRDEDVPADDTSIPVDDGSDPKS